jgi:hypothetical protein
MGLTQGIDHKNRQKGIIERDFGETMNRSGPGVGGIRISN